MSEDHLKKLNRIVAHGLKESLKPESIKRLSGVYDDLKERGLTEEEAKELFKNWFDTILVTKGGKKNE